MGKGGNAPVFQVILLRELGDVRQGQQTRSDPVVFRSIATFLNMSSVTVVAIQNRTVSREESERAWRKLVGVVDQPVLAIGFMYPGHVRYLQEP